MEKPEADLSDRELKRMSKAFDKKFNASTYAIMYEQKEKNAPKPNLNRARSGSSSSIASNMETDESVFIHPNKTRRISNTGDNAVSSVTQNNRCSILDTEEGETSNDNILSAKNSNSKSPPIYLRDMNIKATISLMKENKINKECFQIKQINDDLISIIAKNTNNHEEIINMLIINKKKFHSYTPKSEKIKTLVLKGIRGGYDENEIKAELDELNLNDVKITKVSKLQFDRSKPHIYHFLVQLDKDSNPAGIVKTEYILNQKIKWERLRKKPIFQCKKCQRIGHASSNCHLDFRCVKCAETHEPGKCKINKVANKEAVKCANCGKTGHPASYRGCTYIAEALKIKRTYSKNKNIMMQEKVKRIERLIEPGLSYANILTNKNRYENIAQQKRNTNEVQNITPKSNQDNTYNTEKEKDENNTTLKAIQQLLITLKQEMEEK